jgi:hypothetical protein
VEKEEGKIFKSVGAGDARKGVLFHASTIMTGRDIGGPCAKDFYLSRHYFTQGPPLSSPWVIIIPVTIRLYNYSRWENENVRRVVHWVAKDLKLKRDIKFIFQTTWTDIDEDGEIVPDSEAEVGFDGDAYDNGVVRVCIGKLEYPFVYNINKELKGLYLRHITELKDSYEMLLYMAAHELRHLWQWEHPDKTRHIRKLLQCDDETDADIYAMMTLSLYRDR